jgi:DNA-directed RNA polymerase subunit L
MQVKVLEKKANELKIEIEGEDHSFCNVLQRALLEDDTIEMAGYDIPHPLVSNPIVYVRTRGQRRPETALRNAAEKIRKGNKEVRETFEKALKEWQKNKSS